MHRARLRLLYGILAAALLPATAGAQIVTGSGAGQSPAVRVIEANGTDRTFMAYDPAFPGGVHVALGDVTGDGVLDIITGAGPGGGPHVRIWNGVDLTEVGGFFAYDPAFAGGVWVAAGDVNGDGRADIITGAGAGGGPHVRVWSGADLTELAGFFAYYPAFPGGVTVAAGDVNGDGLADIITGAGPGGGPHVRIWNGADMTELGGFFAYYTAFPGGVYVAAGDIDGDGRADIITGAGAGGGPHVRVWSGATLAEIGGFYAFDPAFPGGVSVGAIDLTYDGRVEIITGAGPGGLPLVAIWNGADLSLMGAYFAQDPSFRGGVFIGSVGSSNALRFTSANVATFTVGTPGTFTVTTTGGTSTPALTVSGSLPAGVTFTDNANGTATLAGTPGPGTGGTYNLTFTANNGVAAPVTQTFTLTVRLGPSITSANAAAFTVGAAGSHTVTTTGAPTPAVTASGALPAGVTFIDNGDGTATLAGTPGAGTGGSYPLVITAANGVGSPATQNFTLTVQQAPAFTSAAATTFVVGSPGTFTITATGTPAVTSIVRSGAALPTGITYVDNGNGTATLSGTPAAGTGGAYALIFTINNGVGGNVVQNFTLTVQEAPAITSADNATFVVGTPGSFLVTTTGFPAASIGSTVGLPAGVTFTDNGNGTATIAGTPGAGAGGSYAITISAMNGVGAVASQSFTLNVNQAPAFTSAAATTFVVGTPGTFTVTTSGTPAVTSIVRSGAALPTGITYVDNGNGTATLSGTPAAGTGGAYALIFTINNGVGGNVVQSLTLTVQEAPAITSTNATTFTIGSASSFSVTTTGIPAPGVAQGGATLPTGVTFVDNLNGTGTLSGTPAAGTAGPYALTFTASNGVGSPAVQNFTLTVACAAITVSPAAGALAGGTYQQAYSQTFTAIGGSGHTFAVTAGTLPAGLTLDGGGALTGSPTNTGNFSFTVTATDAFGCTGLAAYTLAVVPNAQNEAFLNGVGNTQYVVAPGPASPTPAVLTVGTVLSNDAGPGTLSAGPANITSVAGGSVAMGANGAFVYTPPVGFTGVDTFDYVLTDGNGITDLGTVAITLANVIWYVNSAGGSGDGRSHLPFSSVTSAQAPSLPGHYIYVHVGAGPTTGTIVLKTNQTLWGAGAGFILNGLVIPSAGAPQLTGTVTVADGVLVNSLNIDGAGGAALAGTNVAGNVAVTSVNITGGTTGVNLTNLSGTVNFTTSAVSGVSPGPSFLMSAGNGNVSGRLALTNTTGRSVDIQNKTGGNVTLGAAISDTGSGIFLNNNTGAVINFTGGLSISTGPNPAFTATGGGVVNATQNNTSIVNTLATTTGTALTVSNTTIGGPGLTFRSISANGAVNGIVLNNTGISGGLTVTGTGAAGSGGTIQNTTAPGILITTSSNVNLASIILQNSGDDGLRATNLTGFTLANSFVLNNGNAVTERGLEFTGLFGTATVNASTVSGSAEDNLYVANASGTLTLTVSGTPSTCQFTNTSVTVGNDGILLIGDGTANMSVSVSNCTFNHNRGDHFQAATTGVNTAVMSVTFTNNTLIGDRGTTYAGTDLGGGITINPGGGAQTTFDVLDNNIQGATSSAITINLGGDPLVPTPSASLSGTVSGNIIGSAALLDSGSSQGDGINIASNGAGTTTVAVLNNTIRQYSNLAGISIAQRDGNGSLNATVSGNTIANPGSFASHGILAQAGAASGDQGLVCANLGGAGGNSIVGAGANGGADFRVRQRLSTTFQLPGYAGAATDTAAVVSFIQGLNGGATGTATVNSPPGAGFVGGGACIQP